MYPAQSSIVILPSFLTSSRHLRHSMRAFSLFSLPLSLSLNAAPGWISKSACIGKAPKREDGRRRELTAQNEDTLFTTAEQTTDVIAVFEWMCLSRT